MHKQHAAESLLALVTTRERATSTVGDLIEHRGGRGSLWFWTSVLRTAAALLWRSLAAEPWRILKVGLRGWLIALSLGTLAQGSVIVVTFGSLGILYSSFGTRELNWSHIFENWAIRGTYYVSLFGLPILTNCFAGRWTARRAAGLELPAGFSLAFVQFALYVVMDAVVVILDSHGIKPPSGSWSPPADVLPFIFAGNFAALLASIAGAIQVRRQVAR